MKRITLCHDCIKRARAVESYRCDRTGYLNGDCAGHSSTPLAVADQCLIDRRRTNASLVRHRRDPARTTMNFNRRSTLQRSADSRSNLPMPTTGQKQPHGMRMSVNAPVFGTSGSAMKPRQSVIRPYNANALLQSTSKQNIGKTPLKASVHYTRFMRLSLDPFYLGITRGEVPYGVVGVQLSPQAGR